MKQQYFHLVRGLPGSGKTTLAKMMLYHIREAQRDCSHFEADMYFMEDGVYKFDLNQLAQAHEWCRQSVYSCLQRGEDCIVSNTFTTLREMRPYFVIARKFGVVPNVITCQSNYGSVHGVPEETMIKMRARFNYDISSLFEEPVDGDA